MLWLLCTFSQLIHFEWKNNAFWMHEPNKKKLIFGGSEYFTFNMEKIDSILVDKLINGLISEKIRVFMM